MPVIPAVMPFPKAPPQLTEQDLLNRFGPPAQAMPMPALEIDPFVKEQFLTQGQGPGPSRMDQVYDRFMTGQLNVPMNVKALAGIHPLAASRFIEQQGALQQSDRAYGASPEERMARAKLMGATQLGTAHLGAQADRAGAIAGQNVGMRRADADFLGGLGQNIGARNAAEIQARGFDKSLGALMRQQDRMFQREEERYREGRESTKRDRMTQANVEIAKSEIARIDNAEQRAIRKVEQALGSGQIDAQEAERMMVDIQERHQEARSDVQGRMAGSIFSSEESGKVSPLDRITPPKAPTIGAGVFDLAPYRAKMEREFMNAESGTGITRLRNFLQAIGPDYENDPRLQAMVRKFIEQKFPQAEIEDIKNPSFARKAADWTLGLIPSMFGVDTYEDAQRRAGY